MLEVHVTFSREMFGPDVPASVTTAELRQLVLGIRFVEKMMANPVDKEDMARDMEELRKMFTKSVVARRNLEVGTILTNDDVTLKKPGTGIPAARLPEILGRRLNRSIAADTMLCEQDFE
jgi:N-acetylneuraminate synthase